LIDKDGTAKLVDFQFAKWGNASDMSADKISEQHEVHAFGIVLLELLLNPRGRGIGQTALVVQLTMPERSGAIERVLDAIDLEACWPTKLAHELAKLAISCLDTTTPQSRPAFVAVSRELKCLCKQYGAPRDWNGAVLSRPAEFDSPSCDDVIGCDCAQADTGSANPKPNSGVGCWLLPFMCMPPPLEPGNWARAGEQQEMSVVGANDDSSFKL